MRLILVMLHQVLMEWCNLIECSKSHDFFQTLARQDIKPSNRTAVNPSLWWCRLVCNVCLCVTTAQVRNRHLEGVSILSRFQNVSARFRHGPRRSEPCWDVLETLDDVYASLWRLLDILAASKLVVTQMILSYIAVHIHLCCCWAIW